MQRLSFKNPKRGQVKRAAFYLRWTRQYRRKRAAIALKGLQQALERTQFEYGRLLHIAAVYGVPMEPMGPIPTAPKLPSQAWIEHLQDMGDLKPPVNDKPPVKPAPEPDPRDAFAISWNKPRDAT
jgi:hypothetical protein